MVVDTDEKQPRIDQDMLNLLKGRLPVLSRTSTLTPSELKEVIFDVRGIVGSIPGKLGMDPAEFARQLTNQPNGKKVKVALDFFKPTAPNMEQALKSIDNNAQLIRLQTLPTR